MSTIAYAALTTKREADLNTRGESPTIPSYVAALAALVPAEVLALHALILSVTTETEGTGTPTVTITDTDTLAGAFWGLIVLSMILYAAPRWKKWSKLDGYRVCVPPIAFVAWTMLQRATAFDAVCSSLSEGPRTVIALFVAVLLGLVAAALADKPAPPVPPSPEYE